MGINKFLELEGVKDFKGKEKLMEENKNITGVNGGTAGNDGGANIEMQKEIDRAVSKALATQKAKLDK